MNKLVLAMLLCAACGDNSRSPGKPVDDAPIDTPSGPIRYTDPVGGKLRLVQAQGTSPTETTIVLELAVGSQSLTGYSVGFDLALDDTKVKLDSFLPGTALSAGTAPVAALAALPQDGPLAHHLVTAQSQKASGTGAVPTDTYLPPGTSLYTFELSIIGANGVVFDGAAPGFVLTSGGMRDRVGNTIVDAKDVAIGKLVVSR